MTPEEFTHQREAVDRWLMVTVVLLLSSLVMGLTKELGWLLVCVVLTSLSVWRTFLHLRIIMPDRPLDYVNDRYLGTRRNQVFYLEGDHQHTELVIRQAMGVQPSPDFAALEMRVMSTLRDMREQNINFDHTALTALQRALLREYNISSLRQPVHFGAAIDYINDEPSRALFRGANDLRIGVTDTAEYTFNATRADFRGGALTFGQAVARMGRRGSMGPQWFNAIYGIRPPNVRVPSYRMNAHRHGLAATTSPTSSLPVDEFMGPLTGRDMKRPKAYPVREPPPVSRWEILMGPDTI